MFHALRYGARYIPRFARYAFGRNAPRVGYHNALAAARMGTSRASAAMAGALPGVGLAAGAAGYSASKRRFSQVGGPHTARYNKMRRLSDGSVPPLSPPPSSPVLGPRRPRGPKYNTVGRLGPRFPKGTKKIVPYKMLKKGSMLHTERGGIFEAPISNTMYIGHNFEMEDIMRAQCRALLISLFQKAGMPIKNWDARIQADLKYNINVPASSIIWSIIIEYTQTPAPLVNNTVTYANFDTNATVDTPGAGQYTGTTIKAASLWDYKDLAEHLFTVIRAVLIVPADGKDVRFMKMHFHFSSAQVPISSISMVNSRFTHQLKSRLKLLNRTLAASTAVGDADADQADDIAANPLEGYVYDSPMDRSAFIVNQGQRGLLAPSPSISLAGPRLIQATSPDLPLCCRKPPKPFVLSCQKSAKVRLAPGEIRVSYINYVKSIGLNDFINMFRKTILAKNLSGDVTEFNFGKASLFGLETTLNTRTNQPVNISVGYELEQDINVMFTELNSVPAPIIQIL